MAIFIAHTAFLICQNLDVACRIMPLFNFIPIRLKYKAYAELWHKFNYLIPRRNIFLAKIFWQNTYLLVSSFAVDADTCRQHVTLGQNVRLI
jgi:hypothetical protein